MPLQWRSHVSEASQQIWLDNEGCVLGRLVPVDKGKKGSRRRVLYAGEARLKLQRGPGLAVMVTAYRRLSKVNAANVVGLREARLSVRERDAHDRHSEVFAARDELDEAKDMQRRAVTRNEKLEALERREAAQARLVELLNTEDDRAWWDEVKARVMRELGG